MSKVKLIFLVFVLLACSFAILFSRTYKYPDVLFNVSPVEFKDFTTIEIVVSEKTPIVLAALDSKDNVCLVIYEGSLDSGSSIFTWDGTDSGGKRLPEGNYTLELRKTQSFTSIKRFVILK